jgi:hypothetical protein
VNGTTLPGGLSAWRARWLLLAAGWPGAGRCDRSGVRVRKTNQPALHALALQAATDAGTPVPPRVWLDGEPAVTVHAGRRPCVHIGLPLVHALSETELRALVAHRLAPRGFSRLRLVSRLHRAWHHVREEAADQGRPPGPRRSRLLAQAARFADKVDRYADAVPVPLLGLRRTALMLARAETVSLELTYYLATTVQVAVDNGYLVTDLHDGWRRLLDLGGVGETAWGGEVAEELAARHPRLAPAITALGAEPVSLDHPQGTAPLAPMAARVQRRLARPVLGPEADWRRVLWRRARWRTLDEVPPDVWRRNAVQIAAGVTANVAVLLGRAPADVAEVVTVLTTRPRELAALDGGDPANATAAPALLAVFEGALLERGWRRADPVLPGVLVSPAGKEVDGRALDAVSLEEVLGDADRLGA